MVMATKVAKAANNSEKAKHTKYDRHAFDHNMEVCPMAFEVQGKWGESAHRMFSSLFIVSGSCPCPYLHGILSKVCGTLAVDS